MTSIQESYATIAKNLKSMSDEDLRDLYIHFNLCLDSDDEERITSLGKTYVRDFGRPSPDISYMQCGSEVAKEIKKRGLDTKPTAADIRDHQERYAENNRIDLAAEIEDYKEDLEFNQKHLVERATAAMDEFCVEWGFTFTLHRASGRWDLGFVGLDRRQGEGTPHFFFDLLNPKLAKDLSCDIVNGTPLISQLNASEMTCNHGTTPHIYVLLEIDNEGIRIVEPIAYRNPITKQYKGKITKDLAEFVIRYCAENPHLAEACLKALPS